MMIAAVHRNPALLLLAVLLPLPAKCAGMFWSQPIVQSAATMQAEPRHFAHRPSRAQPLSARLGSLQSAEIRARNSGDAAAIAAAAAPLTQAAEDALRQPGLSAGSQAALRSLLADTYNDWGTALARQQDYTAALGRFHQAEHWDAAEPGVMRNVGLAAFRLRDYAESARALEIALLAEPSDARSRIMLAVSLFSLSNYKEAARQFEQAPALAQADPLTAYEWAISLASTQQQPRANQLADALSAQPLPPAQRLNVCGIYSLTENYEHAASCFGALSREDPSLPGAHYGAGAALIRLDRPAEAEPELRAELRLAPSNTQAQYLLAYALLATSHRDEATSLLQSLVALAPGYGPAQYQLGKVLLEDGKTGEAIEHLEAAAHADPRPDYVHYQLQIAYRRAGRAADADRELAIYRGIKAQRRESAADSIPH